MAKQIVNFIQLHGAMVRSSEGCCSTDANGAKWKDIYLDNVRGDIEPIKFRSMLSVLAKKGLYIGDHTGDFGLVRVA